MSIVARLVCFLFIFIHTVSCTGNCYALQKPAVAGAEMLARSGLRLSVKKDRLSEPRDMALQSFITASALPFMLEPRNPLLYVLHAFFGNRPEELPRFPEQVRGIVAGLKAKMLFPVHYFW